MSLHTNVGRMFVNAINRAPNFQRAKFFMNNGYCRSKGQSSATRLLSMFLTLTGLRRCFKLMTIELHSIFLRVTLRQPFKYAISVDLQSQAYYVLCAVGPPTIHLQINIKNCGFVLCLRLQFSSGKKFPHLWAVCPRLILKHTSWDENTIWTTVKNQQNIAICFFTQLS